MPPRSTSLDTPGAPPTRQTRPPPALFLGKPLLVSASVSSTSLNSLPPTQPQTPSYRPHISLAGLLPRHAVFRARVTIHQVHSVPFVSGEFAVRWKLKGVQSPAGAGGLLERVVRSADKGKAREDASRPGTPTQTEGGWMQKRKGTAPTLSSSSSSKAHGSHLPADWTTGSVSSTSATASISTTSTSNSTATSTATSTPLPTPPRTPIAPSTTTLTIPPVPPLPVLTTPARGMTAFLPLKEHSVVWGHTLDTLVRIDVDRESGMLGACQAKLVVMQRVEADDVGKNGKAAKHAGKPQSPRLGAVYLNLAEYVGQGQVERRYLLRESKVNATLRITVEMEHVSGETTYTPPPLAPGEILTGLAGFLDQDVVRRRPNVRDVYGPYRDQEELEIDLLGAVVQPEHASDEEMEQRPQLKHSGPSDRLEASSLFPTHSSRSIHQDEYRRRPDLGVSFDVQRLPFAYGTKTTETLIEALFNPTRTTERRNESPFTYYDPPEAGAEEPTTARPTPTATPGTARPPGMRQTSTSTMLTHSIADSASAFGTNSTITTTTTTTTSSSAASVRTTESSGPRGRGPRDWNWDKRERTPMPGRDASVDAGEDAVPGTVQERGAGGGGGVRAWWKRRVHGPAGVGPKA